MASLSFAAFHSEAAFSTIGVTFDALLQELKPSDNIATTQIQLM